MVIKFCLCPVPAILIRCLQYNKNPIISESKYLSEACLKEISNNFITNKVDIQNLCGTYLKELYSSTTIVELVKKRRPGADPHHVRNDNHHSTSDGRLGRQTYLHCTAELHAQSLNTVYYTVTVSDSFT